MLFLIVDVLFPDADLWEVKVIFSEFVIVFSAKFLLELKRLGFNCFQTVLQRRRFDCSLLTFLDKKIDVKKIDIKKNAQLKLDLVGQALRKKCLMSKLPN